MSGLGEMLADLTLATVNNDDLLRGFTRLGAKALNFLHNIHALDHLSEYHVFPVQPLSLSGAEEKLGPVGVGSSVGHGKNSRSSVFQSEVLILELVAIDRLSSGAISSSEVTTLAHEVGDDAVEGGSLESEPLLPGAEGAEVLRGLGNHIRPQLHDNFANGGTISGDIEENTSSHGDFVEISETSADD